MARSSTHALPAQKSARPVPLNLAGVSIAPWAVLVAASFAIAGLTLLLPSSPTYDPWAWIIWGREIAHLDLQTTGGPSWKPLPVMFTTIFSVFGSAAPDLWLLVARAGALLSLVAAFFLVRRLGGGWVGATAAIAGLAMAPWFVRNAAYGNSEPLLVAFLLGAIERDLAQHKKVAFGLAVAAALMRPEIWPFLAAYSLWLIYRKDLHWAIAVAGGAAVVALWTLPEQWGSGNWNRAADRAQTPNSDAPTFADHPALQVFHNTYTMLTVPVIAGLVVAGYFVYRRTDRRVAALFAFAVLWTALVALMTQSAGFSGNNRYLIPAVSILIVLAGLGAGFAVDILPRRGELRVLVAAALVVAFGAGGWNSLNRTFDAIDYQARLNDALPGLIKRAGGVEKLKRCGDVYTGPFLVPAVAWNMKIHTLQVGLKPRHPAVVFREKSDGGARRKVVPPMYDVSGHNLALADNWRLVGECRR